jgi:hypothetical protein
MSPDGARRWRLDLELPSDANASWAVVPDAAAATPSFSSRLRARVSVGARVELGNRMVESFSMDHPVSPSLYRMIGADPGTPLEPNIGLIPTPHAATLDPAVLARPDGNRAEARVASRRFATAAAGDEALLLDGEVLRRSDAELAATGWSLSYLHNRDAVGRMRDNARPLTHADELLPGLEAAGSAPLVVVGASAAAPTALALALRLGAKRAVLLSPAFFDARSRQRLITDAARADIRIDVRAGSEEHGAGNPQRSIRDGARRFAEEVGALGGAAEFTEFAGGHDLPAWRVALRDALHDARAASDPYPAREDNA